jgi:hypothetical protein
LGGALLLALSLAGSPAQAQGGPGYQVVSNDPSGLEIRFHGVGLRGVRADDAQNALALDFQNPVDGAMFDRLPGDMPQWISMAYANFDNGVIRSPRPVTFLTRAESDGFSLRIVPRGPVQGPPPQMMAQGPPPAPPPMRGPDYGPMRQIWPPPPAATAPPPGAFHAYGDYAALRAYEGQELAVRRADPMWSFAYGRAAMQGDSAIALANETNWYHGGDRMIASDLSGKLTFAPGIAFVGDVKFTDVSASNPTIPGLGSAAIGATQLVTGQGGFAFELGRDSELRLEASEGNNITGGALTFYAGEPTGFAYVRARYHAVDLDTPVAVAARADTDDALVGYTQQLGYGLWGSLAGAYTRYGVRGDANVARTAGWNGNLRWNSDNWNGLLLGLSYDAHAEYLIDSDIPAAASALFVRNMENHAITANLSALLGDGLWLSAYAGYVVDRYASDGLLAGADLHYTWAPGVDLALGVRQSAVSYTQGERGRQTTAGLNLTVGMGAPPQPSWLSNQF